MSLEDRSRALELAQELNSRTEEVSKHIENLLKRVQDGEFCTEKGVSFLEMKYQMLLSYVINLTHLLCVKMQGMSINGIPDVHRLVEIRTILEKVRPIDQKLKYQIDKLVKTATTGVVGENDPLRFKPNPDNMANKLAEAGEEEDSEAGDDDSEAEDGKDKTKTGVYRPPRITPMHYDGDITQKEREEQIEKKVRKKILSRSIMKDLQAEYYEGPEEIVDSANVQQEREDRSTQERQEYEEKYFLRMNPSKAEKLGSRQMRTMSALNDIASFSGLGDDMLAESQRAAAKKRKLQTKGKGGKGKKSKGSKKRRKH